MVGMGTRAFKPGLSHCGPSALGIEPCGIDQQDAFVPCRFAGSSWFGERPLHGGAPAGGRQGRRSWGTGRQVSIKMSKNGESSGGAFQNNCN